MKSFTLKIRVRYKEGILDPQAEAIHSALSRLDFKTVDRVECDKLFMISMKAEDEAEALYLGREMANKLLASVVMDNFEVEVASP